MAGSEVLKTITDLVSALYYQILLKLQTTESMIEQVIFLNKRWTRGRLILGQYDQSLPQYFLGVKDLKIHTVLLLLIDILIKVNSGQLIS